MNRSPFASLLAALGAILLAAAHGCGAERPARDAGPVDSAAVEAAADSDAVGTPCEPGLQDCPAGMKCDFFCDGNRAAIGCRNDNGMGASVGSPCTAGVTCKKGSGCFAAASSTAACRQYCTSDTDCTAGRCQVATITVACGTASMPLAMKICF